MMTKRLSFLRSYLAAACVALIVSGCAGTSGVTGDGVAIDPSANDLTAFMEAKDRSQTKCTSQTLLSTNNPLADIVFTCPELGAQATLAEMKDAGWRMVGLDIGPESNATGELVEMPLTITVIKLF